MKKELLDKTKRKLEKEKDTLEEELQKFANKDKNLKGDWDAKYPNFGEKTGNVDMEEAADEVEEYGCLVPIEHTLELKLRDVNLALKKIKEGKYGICEVCGEIIPKERISIHPEARHCIKCETNK